jgi:predicted RNase H-like HicB family nuclease
MQGYIALIYPPDPDAAGEMGVTFPDVPGCTTCAPTFAGAVEAAREALSGHLAVMRADGDEIPAPRTWEAIAADPEFAGEVSAATPQLITPRLVPGERVRVNITIDRGLLRRADEAADARGLTRSGLIEAALTDAIEA